MNRRIPTKKLRRPLKLTDNQLQQFLYIVSPIFRKHKANRKMMLNRDGMAMNKGNENVGIYQIKVDFENNEVSVKEGYGNNPEGFHLVDEATFPEAIKRTDFSNQETVYFDGTFSVREPKDKLH